MLRMEKSTDLMIKNNHVPRGTWLYFYKLNKSIKAIKYNTIVRLFP